MEYAEAMEGEPVSYDAAKAELLAHGAIDVEPGESGDSIRVYAENMDGSDGAWETIPLDSAAILEWLGY